MREQLHDERLGGFASYSSGQAPFSQSCLRVSRTMSTLYNIPQRRSSRTFKLFTANAVIDSLVHAAFNGCVAEYVLAWAFANHN